MKRIRSSTRQTGASPAAGRRGTILVLFMLSLLLLSLTVGVLIRATMTQRQLVRGELRRVQTDWLVHSATARAAQQLQTDPDYSGETWQIAAEDIDQRDPAVAEIQVVTDLSTESRRLVTIAVQYPPDVSDRIQLTRTVPVAVGTSESN